MIWWPAPWNVRNSDCCLRKSRPPAGKTIKTDDAPFTNVRKQRLYSARLSKQIIRSTRTLIGISAAATGHLQSLNTFDKKSTYLESMSLRNRLLTYWSMYARTNGIAVRHVFPKPLNRTQSNLCSTRKTLFITKFLAWPWHFY